jgi:hypothetical protein
LTGSGSLFSTPAGSIAGVALLLALLAIAGLVALLARQQRLIGQYEHLMTGTSGGSLEALLHDHVSVVRATASRMEVVDGLAQRLERAGQAHLQHLGMVRFNPFQDTGGDQSFAIALADGNGNGLVFTSLHSRDVTRAYAKPLQEWRSSHSLMDEEQQAIALARNGD